MAAEKQLVNDLNKYKNENKMLKECLKETLGWLETYWEFIPNSHRITCGDSFMDAYILIEEETE